MNLMHLEIYKKERNENKMGVKERGKKSKELNALDQLYKQEDVLHIDTDKCDFISNSSEFEQLQKTIYNALEEISRLSEFGNNKDYEEFEFAYKVAHLIDDIIQQARIMKLGWNYWYYIKEKKGEIKDE